MSQIVSPNLLQAKPIRARGVRRLNRWPIYLAMGFILSIALSIGYVFHERALRQQAHAVAAKDSQAPHGATAGDAFDVVVHKPLPVAPAPRVMAAPPPVPAAAAGPAAEDAATAARVQAWQAYYQAEAQRQKAVADSYSQALSSGTDWSGAAAGTGPGTAGGTTPGQVPGTSGAPPLLAGAPGSNLPRAGVDASAQAEKRAFLNQGGDVLGMNEDLQATKHGPKPSTIMEGTAIPGIMVGGLTSDMPGMVVGEVSQNVCDTATGNLLLIPQGSRVIGIYDNSVSNGQERIGVIWNRIIYPDTSSVQLGSMEGADQGGYAGFHDQVDTHFWSKFGDALLISIAGAGAQLSQPQAQYGYGQQYNPTQIASASLGQQMSQLGQAYARNGMSIPNTLEVRPGYPFTLMVNKDMHLPAVGGVGCGGGSAPAMFVSGPPQVQ